MPVLFSVRQVSSHVLLLYMLMALKLICASSFQNTVDYSYFLRLLFFWWHFKMSSLACCDVVYELKQVVQANY